MRYFNGLSRCRCLEEYKVFQVVTNRLDTSDVVHKKETNKEAYVGSDQGNHLKKNSFTACKSPLNPQGILIQVRFEVEGVHESTAETVVISLPQGKR